MRNSAFRCLIAGLGVLLAVAPAFAHHSFAAEYDSKKPVKLTGAVTKIDWSNPHVYFFIDVEDESGHVANWAFEMGPPNALLRRGWKKSSMQLGAVIKLALILLMGTAFAQELASTNSQLPLLIQDTTAPLNGAN